MNIRERKQYNRLRRRCSFILLMSLLLLVWIKNLYDDKRWYMYEHGALFYSNLKKDSQIRTLSKKIDSLNIVLKGNIPSVVEVPKVKKKKNIINDTTSVKDSILVIKKPESDSTEKTDSIK